MSVFTWPFSEVFDDCQCLMLQLQFIFRQFILTIIIFIIMQSVNPPLAGAAPHWYIYHLAVPPASLGY